MPVKTISVTQFIKECLGSTPPSTHGGFPVYGQRFHKIAEEFVTWLTSNKDSVAQTDSEEGIWHELYDRFAEKSLNDIINQDKRVDSAYHLSQALKAFCSRLLELRKRTSTFNSWQDVFFTQEYAVNAVRFDVGMGAILISGRIDAVRSHPEHGLEIVDYKLNHGANMKHDMLQLSIYARLLAIAKPGINFHASIEYYEPQLHVVDVSHRELDAIFEEVVTPVLYKLVHQKKPPPDPHPDRDLSQEIERCYASFKLNVEVIGKQEAPQLIRYMIKPSEGVKTVSLVSRTKDLQVHLSLKKAPLIEPAEGYITIDIPKERPDVVLWKDIIKTPSYVANNSPVAFPIGIGVDNQVLVADLADPLTCHILVAGTTGSGKSEFLKCVLASLIERNSPQMLRFSIIDPKQVTFALNTSCSLKSEYMREPIISNVEATIDCLQRAIDEMERRYTLLANEGFDNISSLNRSGTQTLPYYVIIVDEFGDIVLSASKVQHKLFESLVVRLAATGRASGIHMILTTQRPDKNIVTGLIKANLPLKVCLRVVNSNNSNIVLDGSGAETLLGNGDLLCDRGKGLERAQSPLLQY
ncbi:MAG: PD-(D/E)XK nuclease family protein [Nitrospirae bacterium]|nr:PD-(D/E)XK nuclease family protein [Nitrospirota bacterium]